jgi:hypothetical protein
MGAQVLINETWYKSLVRLRLIFVPDLPDNLTARPGKI